MQNPVPPTPRYELVAQIHKTKGLKGQLIAQELGELSVLRPGLEVWIVPPTLEGARHTVVEEAQDDFKKHGVLIYLEGVEDRTQATELIGRYLLARSEQVEEAQRLNDLSFEGEPDEYDELDERAELDGRDERDEQGEDASSLKKATVRAGTPFSDTVYGALGELDTLKPGPAYDIWVVIGPYGRLEIPAVDDYVVEQLPELVTLKLPQGFVEMTAQDNPQKADRQEGGSTHAH